MRLTAEQQHHIQRIVHAHLGTGAGVFLFGSRTDDGKRGGDVDLLIEAPQRVSLMQQAALKLALEDILALPVDLLITESGKPASAFQALAKARSQPIGRPVEGGPL